MGGGGAVPLRALRPCKKPGYNVLTRERIADNRIFNLGVDDMAAFDASVLELKDDLDIPGFDEDMLKTLVMDTSEADTLISGYGVIPENEISKQHEGRLPRHDDEKRQGL